MVLTLAGSICTDCFTSLMVLFPLFFFFNFYLIPVFLAIEGCGSMEYKSSSIGDTMHHLPKQVSAFDFDRRRSTSVTFGLKELLRPCDFNTGTIILTTVRNLANLRRAVRDARGEGWGV